MACSVTISNIVGLGTPVPTAIKVNGGAVECSSVKVSVTCPGPTAVTKTVTVPVDANGTWTAEVDHVPGCTCGHKVHVHAACVQNPLCQTTFFGDLICEQPENCPIVDVEVVFGECNPDGTRNVTLVTTVTPQPGPVVSQWDFGDGVLGMAQTTLGPAPETFSVTHAYLPSGPYTAALNVILPQGCPPASVLIGALLKCPVSCPEVVKLTADVSGCAGSGANATVSFSGVLSPPQPNCTFKWDFGDGSQVVTPGPATTHSYSQPGDYAVAVVAICGGNCIEPSTLMVHIPPCCPVLTGASGSVQGCAGAGKSATVTFTATTDPPSAAGTYTWTFDDGSLPASTQVPTIDHTYSTPGTKTIQVGLMPTVPGCGPSVQSATVSIPACPSKKDRDDQQDKDRDGGGGGGCGGLLWAAVALLAAGITALAFHMCIPIPQVQVVLQFIGWVLIVLYGVLLVIWMILRWFSICPESWCDAAAIHMAILAPLAIVLSVLAGVLAFCFWQPVWWILSPILGSWGTVAAGCLARGD